jgi:hypothetical protein
MQPDYPGFRPQKSASYPPPVPPTLGHPQSPVQFDPPTFVGFGVGTSESSGQAHPGRSNDFVRKNTKFLSHAFRGSWIGGSITRYRDSGRGRKTSLGKKTRSEKYPRQINLDEIKPESGNSEEEPQREIPRRDRSQKEFSGVLRSEYHQIRCLSLLVGDFIPL